MTEWEIITMLITLVSFIGVFAGVAWKFATMITKLQTLIENLSHTIDKMEEDRKEENERILSKIEDHDQRLRQVEKEIIRIGEKHD